MRPDYLWQSFLNFIIPKYFLESIYCQYKEKCTHALFCLCTRAIGNLALKRIWIHFIQAQVYFLGSERTEEAIYLEEFRGAQEITEFYDLVNSPTASTSEQDNKTRMYCQCAIIDPVISSKLSSSKAFLRSLDMMLLP